LTCPIDAPVWNGTQCIGCPVGTHFDIPRGQCLSCPSGFIFDLSIMKCVCPSNAPYIQNGACVAC